MEPATIIFDNLYGFIPLNETEVEIIDSPYFQRLRWIKQLGFSDYTFPGAEHTRLAHALGTLHIMDKMLHAIRRAVPPEKLFNTRARGEAAMFHKTMRLAAMLHDIGQFPFSHTLEDAYIAHESRKRHLDLANYPDDLLIPGSHEELTEFIITQTDFPGGITSILKKSGFDANEIAAIATGTSDNLLATQMLHSEIDADRMDYLLRDAYHTGLKYGHFDSDYLINSLRVEKVNGKEILAIHENALRTVENFLLSRFSWYAQIIKEGRGKKFDFIAARIYGEFLDHKLVYSADEIKRLITRDPQGFAAFHDHYFLEILERERKRPSIRDPLLSELIEMLLTRVAPKQIKTSGLKPRMIASSAERSAAVTEVEQEVKRLERLIRGLAGDKRRHWLLVEMPYKDVRTAKPIDMIIAKSAKLKRAQEGTSELSRLLLVPDPIKIVDSKGRVSLLVSRTDSIIYTLARSALFIANVYTNDFTYSALIARGLAAA
ncbi:MAG: HD domain-containing protein [Deltaproteobacteria bacterium]|nr:HD domain-containing protein [Deltaproteobacteria bacterium]